jgi:hypothetical protein
MNAKTLAVATLLSFGSVALAHGNEPAPAPAPADKKDDAKGQKPAEKKDDAKGGAPSGGEKK